MTTKQYGRRAPGFRRPPPTGYDWLRGSSWGEKGLAGRLGRFAAEVGRSVPVEQRVADVAHGEGAQLGARPHHPTQAVGAEDLATVAAVGLEEARGGTGEQVSLQDLAGIIGQS